MTDADSTRLTPILVSRFMLNLRQVSDTRLPTSTEPSATYSAIDFNVPHSLIGNIGGSLIDDFSEPCDTTIQTSDWDTAWDEEPQTSFHSSTIYPPKPNNLEHVEEVEMVRSGSVDFVQ